mmetsp:Transcript_23490/g.28868  ORF Transcript_23490/g.28868 Transcript_23490/m.28868 type:complete len:203 (-) Transcript_23490:2688-3296(-)
MDNLTRMTPYQFNLSRPPPISTSYIRFKCSYVCLLEGVLAVFLRYRCHRRTLSTVTGVRFRHFAFRSGVEFSLVSESFGIPRFPFLPDGFFRRGHGVPFILQDGIDARLVLSVFRTERMFLLASRLNAKMANALRDSLGASCASYAGKLRGTFVPSSDFSPLESRRLSWLLLLFRLPFFRSSCSCRFSFSNRRNRSVSTSIK